MTPENVWGRGKGEENLRPAAFVCFNFIIKCAHLLSQPHYSKFQVYMYCTTRIPTLVIAEQPLTSLSRLYPYQNKMP